MHIVVLTKDDETTRIQFAEKGLVPRFNKWARANGYTVGLQYQMRFRAVFVEEAQRAEAILKDFEEQVFA